MPISQDEARTIVNAAQAHAQTLGIAVTVAVVDEWVCPGCRRRQRRDARRGWVMLRGGHRSSQWLRSTWWQLAIAWRARAVLMLRVRALVRPGRMISPR